MSRKLNLRIPSDCVVRLRGLPNRRGGSEVSLKRILFLAVAMLWSAQLNAHAAPPDLKTPEPVIYLADNLDEKDNLGWCIDTVGRGLSERLHAHSCKPRGGDVQFRYNDDTRQIMSATYIGKCATLSTEATEGASFGLVDCDNSSPLQLFNYDRQTFEFRPQENEKLCLAVGSASRTAGPFMSRNLILALVRSTETKYKQWRIKAGKS